MLNCGNMTCFLSFLPAVGDEMYVVNTFHDMPRKQRERKRKYVLSIAVTSTPGTRGVYYIKIFQEEMD